MANELREPASEPCIPQTFCVPVSLELAPTLRLLCLPRALSLSQDEDDGGISDRPDDMADVYHTFFGIAGLSLMCYQGLEAIDPTYALPVSTVKRLKAQQAQQE